MVKLTEGLPNDPLFWRKHRHAIMAQRTTMTSSDLTTPLGTHDFKRRPKGRFNCVRKKEVLGLPVALPSLDIEYGRAPGATARPAILTLK